MDDLELQVTGTLEESRREQFDAVIFGLTRDWREDELIPQELKDLFAAGVTPPPGWNPYADPMAKTIQVG